MDSRTRAQIAKTLRRAAAVVSSPDETRLLERKLRYLSNAIWDMSIMDDGNAVARYTGPKKKNSTSSIHLTFSRPDQVLREGIPGDVVVKYMRDDGTSEEYTLSYGSLAGVRTLLDKAVRVFHKLEES